MPRFSERYGYKPIRDQIQKGSVDEQTRTLLWNFLKVALWDDWESYRYGWTEHSKAVNDLMTRMWVHYFNASLDNLPEFNPNWHSGAYTIIKGHFMDAKWFEVYDFLEFVVQNWSGGAKDRIVAGINSVLEKQLCGFRFVSEQIAPITDGRELEAIDQAASNAPDAVKRHISRAVELLSDRDSPDYQNSVKEAISAIEALCQTVTGDNKGTLGKLLGKIDGLHPAFKKALSSMYGFTSDAEGIRHALLDEPTLTFTDAKFFLVQAAAFINYISGKQADKKLKEETE
jgi:AbiJ N-terminal domain 4